MAIVVPVPRARLWSPEQPYLYGLKLALLRNGRVIDSARGYFGMRSIAVGPDSDGVTRLLLNGRPYFEIGPLDQGFWPDGLYTAPDGRCAEVRPVVEKQYGFNMVRKHVKVEPERWYYWTDKLGLLVWQDMPDAFNADDAQRRQFETELHRMVEGRWNHPSIVMWVPFNEGWASTTPRPAWPAK